MVSLTVWLLLGFLAGYIAKIILPGTDGGGVIMTTFVGIIGAVVGGFIGTVVGYPMISNFNNIGNSIPSFISSIVGAIIVLLIFRAISGRKL